MAVICSSMKKIFSVFFVVLSLLLTSCSSLYLPGVPNTPMLSEKGEVAGGAHISLKGDFNLNAAVALTDHFSLMANLSSMKSDRDRRTIKNHHTELGAGYFTTFGEEDQRILEVYAGFGRGKVNKVFREKDSYSQWTPEETQKSFFDKKFIQVNYSSRKKNEFTLFGTTFGLNYGTAIRLSFMNTDRFYRNGLLQSNEDNVFIEPVFFTRMILSEQVQLQYTAGSNFGLKSRQFLNAGHSVFSVGAVVNLRKSAKKTK